MPPGGNSFEPTRPDFAAQSALLDAFSSRPASKSLFAGPMTLPSGLAEHCIRTDFIALEQHMETCATANGLICRISSIGHALRQFVVSRIVCSAILLLAFLVIVHGFT